MKNNQDHFAGFILLAALVAFAAPASASLLGDTVRACTAGPFPLGDSGTPDTCPAENLFASDSAIVGGGLEFNTLGVTLGKHIEVDLNDSGFSVFIANDHATTNFQINGFEVVLEDLDWVGQLGAIDNVVLLAGNTLPDPISATFGDDNISVIFPTFVMLVGESFSAEFNIEARHFDVPEPLSLALAGTGLLGVLLRRRRRWR